MKTKNIYNIFKSNIWKSNSTLSINKIFPEAFNFYFKNIKICLLFAFPPVLAAKYLYLSIIKFYISPLINIPVTIALLLFFLWVWVMIYYICSACVNILFNSENSGIMSISEIISETLKITPRLIVSTSFSIFLIVIGVLLGIIPGYIILIWSSVIAQVTIDENLTGRKAMSRSKELVCQDFYYVANVFAVYAILLTVIGVGATLFVELFTNNIYITNILPLLPVYFLSPVWIILHPLMNKQLQQYQLNNKS